MNELLNKRIVLGLSGGIACYKAAELCRALVKAGAQVQVVMTQAATHFITPVTMQALSNQPVFESQWDERAPNNMAHINLTREADLILVAPASADFMAKLLHGRADDLLSLMCLARPSGNTPLVLAPAMNREMWSHPATQRNVAQLRMDGAHVLGVGQGEQACGETGDGRMLEPDEILQEVLTLLSPKDLLGQRFLLTAGPTFEALDPVRGLTNRSSGKMGYALAQSAQRRGAQVVLVSGPTQLLPPRGIEVIQVESGQQMHDAVISRLNASDVFIACAAVADWRAVKPLAQKIKKSDDQRAPSFELTPNPDILASVCHGDKAQRGELFCVGFAAETENLEQNAKSKLTRKGAQVILGNLAQNTLGRDVNSLLWVDAHGAVEMPHNTKAVLADQVMEKIAQSLKVFFKTESKMKE
jgi:phosphopantothenoylcysteine decarboxylase/phosphopantothenate--cysteine ligase